jgi:opacity protein-like surface antigen
MKKIISLFVAAISLAVTANALHFGASAGYLVDGEEAYYTVRGGLTLKSTSAIIHSAELELGYSELSDSGVNLEIIPLMANYRAELTNGSRFSTYFGAGAGAARVKLGGFGVSDYDTVFAAQAFVGASFKPSTKVSLNVGIRYIWIDDATLFGFTGEIGDDVAIEAGISFKF